MHKLSHPNKAKIIEAIIREEKWSWIQAEYGCSPSTISNYRKELGIKTNNSKISRLLRK